MSDSEEERRPYAAAANIVAVLARTKMRNLPPKIDEDFLQLASIPDISHGRVTEALQFLDLVEVSGAPTETFRSLSKASDDDYKTILEACVREAYKEDFARVDPSTDSKAQIESAFRRYQPRSQTMRMVMLFLGMCREAGIDVSDPTRKRVMAAASKRAQKKNGKTSNEDTSKGSQKGDTSKSKGGAGVHADANQVFGITNDDIADLEDDEFKVIWEALGKLTRKRAQRSRQASEAGTDNAALDVADQVEPEKQ